MVIPIIVIVIVVICIVVVAMYNNLVSLRQRVQNAWSQIDVQLQRRFDLIPNFVETVKGYSKHENGTLEKITALRSEYNNKNHMDIKSANKMLLLLQLQKKLIFLIS